MLEDSVLDIVNAEIANAEVGAESDEELLQGVIDALDDKKAYNIRILDLSEVSDSLSYFVIASGESNLQLKAMQDSVKEKLKDLNWLPRGIEGPSERWILMDYGHMIIHLMSPEARSFYDLEGLWADASEIEILPS
ncbi:MAG: ribosome silencing factor [Deinococcales bacterium]